MSEDEPLREFDRLDEAGEGVAESVVVECDLPDPPEKVWRALTVPDLVAAWLSPGGPAPTTLAPELGRRFIVGAGAPFGGDIACEVLAAEPCRLLSYSWRAGDEARDGAGRPLDTQVSFELSPADDGGTHLRIVHSGFPATARRAPAAANSNVPRMQWAA